MEPRLGVTIAAGGKAGPLELANPVIAAAGTFGTGQELQRLVDVRRLGAIVSPAIAVRSSRRAGEPLLVEVPAGLVVRGAYRSLSYRRVLREAAGWWQRCGTPVLVNTPAVRESDCVEVAEALADAEGVAGLELDFSELTIAGVDASEGADVIARVAAAVAPRWHGPLLAKLGYDATGDTTLARAAEEAGVDALSLGGGFPAVASEAAPIGQRRRLRPGRLVGPATKPLALRLLAAVARAVTIPVIAAGGICRGADAVEFLLAGATAVQVGSATLNDPSAALTVVEELKYWLQANDESDVRNVIAAGKSPA